MVTALAAQLAQIRARSTNSLDLKAQKEAHSQSLLFDPRNAARQDFDTIFQICYEGFEELCRQDSRFLGFSNSIFSEQSKYEDRMQMNEEQNQSLDSVIEDFLSLVGSKLLLAPALKAVEWLIRRFRVHEYNLVYVVFTFLPYHSNTMFTTLLSILPKAIPSILKFLHPYIQSLVNPPRHTIIYVASDNRSFLGAYSEYVLKVTRLGYLYSALTSFWASVTTEAVSSLLVRTQSAKRESVKHAHEDTVLFLLPILNEGLSTKGVPELRVACYMILTILAAKVDLGDEALTGMMEAVVMDWGRTSHAGLICLSVLAQQRQNIRLPERVYKTIIALPALEDDLAILKKQYKIDNLVLSLIDGILRRFQDASPVHLLRCLLEQELLSNDSIKAAINEILIGAQNLLPGTSLTPGAQIQLADLIIRLSNSSSMGQVVQSTVRETELDSGRLEARLQKFTKADENEIIRLDEDIHSENLKVQVVTEDFESLTNKIPTKTAYEISFLSHSDSFVFNSLANAFSGIHSSENSLKRFSDLPVLRKSLAMSEPFFISFFIRFWCGNHHASARAAAIRTIHHLLDVVKPVSDVQILLPYTVYALADRFPQVRRAAADLTLVLTESYAKSEGGAEHKQFPILGHGQIYGQRKESKEIPWLNVIDIRRFTADVLTPGLEECVLDENCMPRFLSDSLNGSKQPPNSKSIHKELKTSMRMAILNNLSSHIVNTSLYSVKIRLLSMLSPVGRVGTTSRTRALLPLLSMITEQSEEEYRRICKREEVDPSQLLTQVVGLIVAFDRDSMDILEHVIRPDQHRRFPSLRIAGLRRLHAMWSTLKADAQLLFTKNLVELAVAQIDSKGNEISDLVAMETLQGLPISTDVLQALIQDLPSISPGPNGPISAPKRRRTSQDHSRDSGPNQGVLVHALKRYSLVLELVEENRPENHTDLLKDLFGIISNLQYVQYHHMAAPDYLLILAMDCMFAMVNTRSGARSKPVDHSVIRTDILIDCIRATSNQQVRNSALLLVSALASVTPDLVLHSIMPIFTFMGANVLRQDDEFSTYVVKQTMESVIPSLIGSLHKGRKGNIDLFTGVSELLLSFAAAFEHIPAQRRLGLYVSLISKVGPGEYLFALLAILMDKYRGDKKVLGFILELCGYYDVEIRLVTMKKYLEVILDARKKKPTLSTPLLVTDKDRNVDSTTANLLPLVFAILGSEALATEITAGLGRAGEDGVIVRRTHSQVLEQIFLISGETKSNPKLYSLSMKILDTSLGALPIPEMINTLQDLLDGTEDSIRLRLLNVLRGRLSQRATYQRATQKASLNFLARLLRIIEESNVVALRQTAIVCVDRIIEKFGRKNIDDTISAGIIISGEKCLGAAEKSLQTASLICLARLVEVTGESGIPLFPNSFTKALDLLNACIEGAADDPGLHNAIFTFSSALFLYVPWIINAAGLDRFLSISYELANAELGYEYDHGRMEALRLIPQQFEARQFFGALKRTWTNAMTEGPVAIKEYLEILRVGIDRHSKAIVVRESEILGDLFINMFDLRRIQLAHPTEDSYTISEIADVEHTVDQCAIAMIYKLNDAAFRPLFLRMSDWAKSTKSKSEQRSTNLKQTAWYTFLLQFFDSLKSIVTNYSGHIIEQSIDIMNNITPTDKDSQGLRILVFRTLHKTFEHDQDGFYQSPNHFEPISTAMLSQLAFAPDIPVAQELIPAIAEMAVATDSAAHHKEMNTSILQYLRSGKGAVRLAAVQCERALTEKLGEEWLALLPEMLPFISETLEDDDEAVEKEVQKWIRGIESILGESLTPMLQ